MNDHQVDSSIVIQVARGNSSADNRAREVGRYLAPQELEATLLPAQEEVRGQGHWGVEPGLVIRMAIRHEQVEKSVIIGIKRYGAETGLGPAGAGQ